MARRGKRFDDDNGDVKDFIDEDVRGVIDEVRGEIRDILTELEIYQRTWIVPWFVQKLMNDLYMRLNLLLEKMRGEVHNS